MQRKNLTRTSLWTALLSFCCSVVCAANVDLATEPLVSGLTKVVAPNVFFILDDSGSMGSDYMPDSVSTNAGNNCYQNFGYNTIYYNPAINYELPAKPDGTFYANSPWTNAPDDGFTVGGTSTNLSQFYSSTNSATVPTNYTLGTNPLSTISANRTITITQVAHGITLSANVTATVTFTNYTSANQTGGAKLTAGTAYNIVATPTANTYTIQVSNANKATSTATGGGTGLKVTINVTTVTTVYTPANYAVYTASPTSPPNTCQANGSYTMTSPTTAADQQNFANWYTYYRTRIQMAKAGAGRAFAALGSAYRVGFTTISEPGTGTTFLNLAKFDLTQKTAWYAKLYAAQPGNSTPLRGALSKAGRLYAGTLVTGNADPVQYSCQQNYTIMTTDGYWNTADETTTYTAKREDNVTDIGDQDGVAGTVRPFLDSLAKPNSLADIAMYYYKTDLRPTAGALGGLTDAGTRVDVSTNNVPTTATDTANWQHMVTFTIGFGVTGVLGYNENYQSGGSPDYTALLQGTKNWPDPLTSPLSSSSTVTARIDDLWHAAVNGHGVYLSAKDPAALVSGLNKTLSTIKEKVASSAAAATSNLEPVAGDNFAYVAQYTTALWTGDIQARSIDLVTGAISSGSTWSAATQMAGKVGASTDTRTIYTYTSSGSTKLRTFTAANLSSEISANYFKSGSTNPGGALSQYAGWSASQISAATDTTMINFIRGQSGYQDNANATARLYRDRASALGDIVDSAPVYVKKPPFNYADAGYSSFVSTNASRLPTVYAGANDGMLHAFDATTGNERWAYIPSAVIPNLYKLADTGYPTTHQFFVDGTVTVGDAFDGAAWHTILVGGLGGGGKQYFALDVTDPSNPKALWEFGATVGNQQDTDLGFTYGNPIITKRASDGKWVVMFTSGYNNTGGDSKGRLYVVDAFSGGKLSEIITDSANANPDQSGIGKITNYVLDTLTDNSTQYVYGGDLAGELWRFDITASSNAGASQRLGQTNATLGNQPITVRPELARVRDSSGTYQRVVYFGTGRYLGFNDLSAASTSATVAQSIFAIKDSGTDLGNFKAAAANLVQQTLDATVSPHTIPNPLPVDWAAKNGWFVNLVLGERVNVDLKLQLGTLVAIANSPKDDYCVVGGSSELYALDYLSGTAITGQAGKYVGFPVGNSIGTGLTLVRLPTGKLAAIVNEADTTINTLQPPTSGNGGVGVRRVGWREIQ